MSTAGGMLVVSPTRRECGTVVLGTGSAAGYRLDALLDSSTVDTVLSAGFAGALRPEWPPGTVVICSHVDGVAADTQLVDAAEAAATTANPGHRTRCGRLVTVVEPVLTPEAKHALATPVPSGGTGDPKTATGEIVGPDIVDMEAAALLDAAQAHSVPLVCLRAVIDGAGDTVPAGVGTILEAQSDPQRPRAAMALAEWSAFTRSLLRRPRDLPHYWRMGNRSAVARTALQAAVPAVAGALSAIVR